MIPLLVRQGRSGEEIFQLPFFRRIGIQVHVDLGEVLPLDGENLLQPNQLQHRQEQAYDFRPPRSALENLLEGHRPVPLEPIHNILGVQLDGRVIVNDLVILRAFADGFHDPAEGVEQVPDLHLFEVHFLLVAQEHPAGIAGELHRLGVGGFQQVAGGVLEGFVLQQLTHQVRSRVQAQFVVVALGSLLGGQEHAGFDLDQRRSHHEEFPREVRIERLEHVHVREVLLGNGDNGNVLDVHLVPTNQEQQQIQRPVVQIQIDAILSHRTAYCTRADGDRREEFRPPLRGISPEFP